MQEGRAAEHGVVAVGDSLLTGYGPALGGLSSQSWGGWLAWAQTTCFTSHAVNGVRADQVVRDQLPLLTSRYRFGVTCSGANDLTHLDPVAFEAAVERICTALLACSDVAAIATLPATIRTGDMSWRRTALQRTASNAIVRQVAARTGVVLVELEEALTSPFSMAPDHQHPTSIGQLEVAHVAAGALTAAGVRFTRHLPDPAEVRLGDDERRLYVVSPWRRLRARWDSVTSLRTDRVITRAQTP